MVCTKKLKSSLKYKKSVNYGVTNARRWSVSLRYKSYTTALGCFRQTTRVYYNSKEVRNYIILTKIQKYFKNVYFQSISCFHHRIFKSKSEIYNRIQNYPPNQNSVSDVQNLENIQISVFLDISTDFLFFWFFSFYL